MVGSRTSHLGRIADLKKEEKVHLAGKFYFILFFLSRAFFKSLLTGGLIGAL
jgi:hypothetical protein